MGARQWVVDRGRPLVVTRDEELLDELLRIADAGGVEVTVAVDAVAAEDGWASAPLVLVGADLGPQFTRRGLPRRLGVILVAGPDRADDPALWQCAEALHVEHVVVLPEARSWLVSRFADHGPGGGMRATARATVVAVVPGSHATAAGELARALAVTARRQGSAVLLISAALPGSEPGGVEPVSGGGGSLAALWLGRAGEASVPPEVMAAALRAGRAERDLVVVDLPYGMDEASLLALTCADGAHLVVVAEVRACAAATRMAAAVRRHCPAVGLVVRAAGPRGLRPAEVAQALDLPLVGVLPPETPLTRAGHTGQSNPCEAGGPLTRLSRRLLADLDLRPRPTAWAGVPVHDDAARVAR